MSDVAKKLLDSSRRGSGGELVTHWKAARLSISDMPFAVRIVLLLVARAACQRREHVRRGAGCPFGGRKSGMCVALRLCVAAAGALWREHARGRCGPRGAGFVRFPLPLCRAPGRCAQGRVTSRFTNKLRIH